MYQDFIYGVFNDYATAEKVIAELHQVGLDTPEICVVGKSSEEFKYVSGRLKDPTAKYFMRFGVAGCIAGLWAGISGAPHIPYTVSFQILIPMMAAVSGGVVLAYFGALMGMFLSANNPHYWASVFEGTVENGNVIVLAEASTREQRGTVMSILDAHDPVELILRRNSAGRIGPSVSAAPIKIEKMQTVPQLSSVA
jgi:hypothetical protein